MQLFLMPYYWLKSKIISGAYGAQWSKEHFQVYSNGIQFCGKLRCGAVGVINGKTTFKVTEVYIWTESIHGKEVVLNDYYYVSEWVHDHYGKDIEIEWSYLDKDIFRQLEAEFNKPKGKYPKGLKVTPLPRRNK